MAQLTPTQLAWRGRIEAGLRIVAPVLDLLLVVSDQVSRVVEREDADPAPPARLTPDRQRALADGHH